MTVSEILKDYDYAFRLKASDGGAMIAGRDGQVWSLTQMYLKPIAPEIVDSYDDWRPMEPEKHAAYYAMLLAMQRGEPVVKIHGRIVTVKAPISETPPEGNSESSNSVSPVSEAAIKSAGQVAEALGIAIETYRVLDPAKADRALTELLWIAKNVSWQTKENRHLFRSKWNPLDAQLPAPEATPSSRELESDEAHPESTGN